MHSYLREVQALKVVGATAAAAAATAAASPIVVAAAAFAAAACRRRVVMVGMVRLDGDGRRRAVGVDFSTRGRDQWALQESGKIEHRGMEGGKRRRRGRSGIEMSHGRRLVQSCSRLPPLSSSHRDGPSPLDSSDPGAQRSGADASEEQRAAPSSRRSPLG